jgi:hypothetical protein
MKKRKTITSSPARFLISDTLPFEVPIIFNNRLFANAAKDIEFSGIDNKVEMILTTNSIAPEFSTIVNLLGGMIVNNNVKLPKLSIPYEFFVPKANGQLRTLAVVNPLYQLLMMVFNETYSNTLLYNCSKSSFSIRKPVKKATWKVSKDNSFFLTQLGSDNISKIEEYGIECEELRSYYVYRQYSNVYKFYDSNMYLELEKKYNYLLRLDISKCFDSIYTHSIPWAIYGKHYVKEHLGGKNGHNTLSCFDKLDKVVQNMNYKETHGIVIGPEFSRIVAEVILQSVDINVEKKLTLKNRKIGVDYSIYRYVDDYFIFFNEEQTRVDIVEILQQELLLYKLYLNKAKEIIVIKPFITGISIAKTRIVDLFDSIFPAKRYHNTVFDKDYKKIEIPFMQSATIIKKYKAILAETNTTYSDTMNYSLAIMEIRLVSLIKDCQNLFKCYKTGNSEDPFIFSKIGNFYVGLARILFFMLSQYPSASISIKVCRNLMLMLESLNSWRRKNYGNLSTLLEIGNHLKQYVFSEICAYLNTNPITRTTPIEGLHLLILARALGKKFRIPSPIIEKYLNIDLNQNRANEPLNYFTIMTVLFYIRNNRNYDKIYQYLLTEIKKQLIEDSWKTENCLMLIDSLSCPYLSEAFKSSLINNTKMSRVVGMDPAKAIEAAKRIHFINWDSFNFSRELDLKQSQVVY